MYGIFRQAVPFGRSTQYLGRDGPEKKIQDWITKVLKCYVKMNGLIPIVNENPFKTFRERVRKA